MHRSTSEGGENREEPTVEEEELQLSHGGGEADGDRKSVRAAASSLLLLAPWFGGEGNCECDEVEYNEWQLLVTLEFVIRWWKGVRGGECDEVILRLL